MEATMERPPNKIVRMTATTLVYTGKCVIESINLAGTDAAATAGTIAVYDGIDDTGTLIHSETVAAAAYPSRCLVYKGLCSTGIYVKITTTADVEVVVSYQVY